MALSTFLALLTPPAGAQVPQHPPDELLRRSDVGALAPAAFRARLRLQAAKQPAPHEIEIWRSGQARTLVRFLDAKERGKYLLRLGSDLWLVTRGAKAPVHMSPSYRLYGGATLDEVLGIRLARDYTLASAQSTPDPQGTLVVFELEAKAAQALFPHVRYVVRQATERPLRAEYVLRSGRAATAVEFVEWSDTRPPYARRVTVKDLLRKGQTTEVEVLELEERAVPDALFDLHDPSARRALEQQAPAGR